MQRVWQDFLNIIRQEAGSQVVETWFKAVTLDSWNREREEVHLRVPNHFVGSWIQDHYAVMIKKHLGRLFHSNNISINFLNETADSDAKRNIIPASSLAAKTIVEPAPHHELDHEEPSSTSLVSVDTREKRLIPHPKKYKRREPAILNEAYLFDSFIVGPNNSLAHAAARAISANLGKVYNPLFIYGGTGLGKTHLMHAIGNEVKAKHPQAIICYETCDRFINEFISSIRLDKASQFREKYEKIDLLLLDDVQFLSNKEQTQEAFFHIFNALYERQKQIVISSDTFPKEINGLQLRLKSRMEWGLVADIQIPDLETKMAILSKKSELHKIDLDDDVAYFIASRVLSNIRELEGALIRVGAFASLTNQTVSVDLAKRVLLHLNEKKKDGVHLDTVVKLIAHEFNVSITDIKSKKRHKDIVHVRQVIFYLMKKLSFSSLQAIGGFIGGRDHSTVIHAIERIEALIKSDHIFEQKIKSLENRLQSI